MSVCCLNCGVYFDTIGYEDFCSDECELVFIKHLEQEMDEDLNKNLERLKDWKEKLYKKHHLVSDLKYQIVMQGLLNRICQNSKPIVIDYSIFGKKTKFIQTALDIIDSTLKEIPDDSLSLAFGVFLD